MNSTAIFDESMPANETEDAVVGPSVPDVSDYIAFKISESQQIFSAC